MAFINTEVDVTTIPLAETISLRPIHPSYHKILRIEWIITTTIFIAIAALIIFFIPPLRTSYGWIVIVASVLFLSIIQIVSIEKSFPFKAYAVREKDVIYQKGWIVRSIKICPFNRIQNCSLQTGPLERKYKLASLIIYTAGAEGGDMRIPGLLQEEAEQLRSFILDKIHSESNETV